MWVCSPSKKGVYTDLSETWEHASHWLVVESLRTVHYDHVTPEWLSKILHCLRLPGPRRSLGAASAVQMQRRRQRHVTSAPQRHHKIFSLLLYISQNYFQYYYITKLFSLLLSIRCVLLVTSVKTITGLIKITYFKISNTKVLCFSWVYISKKGKRNIHRSMIMTNSQVLRKQFIIEKWKYTMMKERPVS